MRLTVYILKDVFPSLIHMTFYQHFSDMIWYADAYTFGLNEENKESDVIISVVHRKLSRFYLERLAIY